MEKIVLSIGGLFNFFGWSDAFFFTVTLILLLLLVYIVYLIKVDEEEENEVASVITPEPEAKPEFSLAKIVDELETNYKPEPIDLSEYEKEMEDTAIISYEELRNKTSNNIYYDDNYKSGFDDVLIQKIDNKESKTQELVNLPQAVMMSYESEEAFYSALKVLQKNLVR